MMMKFKGIFFNSNQTIGGNWITSVYLSQINSIKIDLCFVVNFYGHEKNLYEPATFIGVSYWNKGWKSSFVLLKMYFFFMIINDGVSWEYFHDLCNVQTNEKNGKSR